MSVEGGLSGACLFHNHSRVRGWWGDVLACLSDEKGNWFESALKRRVGNGESTSFWHDAWVGSCALKSSFPRLFELCLDKDCAVASAGVWAGNSWSWGMGWRRELREWESNSLNTLVDLLDCRKSSSAEPDSWSWEPESTGAFTVRSCYNLLLERKMSADHSELKCCKLIWDNWAVPKVQATAWRFLFRRIATKVELARRGALPPNVPRSCPLCDAAEETVEHLFLECNLSWALWMGCLEWLGVQTSLPSKISDHLNQFCCLSKGKWRRELLASIWVCVTWEIWKGRNDIIFNEGGVGTC